MDPISNDYKRVDSKSFASLFGCQPSDIPKEALDILSQIDTRYKTPSQAEFEEYVLQYLNLLKSNRIERNTEQNLAAWTKGWQENLDLLASGTDPKEAVKPKYFRGSKFLRLNKSIVVSPNPQIEHDLFKVARHYLFRKYLSVATDIYEIGCGSGQNLLLLSEIFPEKSIYGLDWVEPPVKIADSLGKVLKRPIKGALFDMMNPPQNFSFEPNSAIITIHAMEQIGNKHEKLLEKLLQARPSLVVHYEPIYEFYDENNVFDYLAMWYSEKRNYLNGLWLALKKLEEKGAVQIMESRRPELGGVLHEASLIVWKPTRK